MVLVRVLCLKGRQWRQVAYFCSFSIFRTFSVSAKNRGFLPAHPLLLPRCFLVLYWRSNMYTWLVVPNSYRYIHGAKRVKAQHNLYVGFPQHHLYFGFSQRHRYFGPEWYTINSAICTLYGYVHITRLRTDRCLAGFQAACSWRSKLPRVTFATPTSRQHPNTGRKVITGYVV